MEFHPHLHFLVPGVGLDVRGKVVRVRQADYLVRLPPPRKPLLEWVFLQKLGHDRHDS